MKYKITIPEPCHEDWSKMTPQEKGRFCDKCQKCVVDFTAHSTAQLFREVASGNQICGRFRPDQLNRFVFEEAQKKPNYFQFAVATVLALFAGKNASGNPSKSNAPFAIEHLVSSDKKVIQKADFSLDTVSVKFLITYDETGEPVNGASIYIAEMPYGGFANFNGEVEVLIREQIKMDSLTFIVEARWREPVGIKISKQDILNRVVVKVALKELNQSLMETGGIRIENERGIVIQSCILPPKVEHKPSFFQKIGNWFKRVF